MYRKFGQENLEEQVEIKKKMVDLLELEKKQEKERCTTEFRHHLEILEMIQTKESNDLIEFVYTSVKDFVEKYKEKVYKSGSEKEKGPQTIDIYGCPYKKVEQPLVDFSTDLNPSFGQNDSCHWTVPPFMDPESINKPPSSSKVFGCPISVGRSSFKTLGEKIPENDTCPPPKDKNETTINCVSDTKISRPTTYREKLERKLKDKYDEAECHIGKNLVDPWGRSIKDIVDDSLNINGSIFNKMEREHIKQLRKRYPQRSSMTDEELLKSYGQSVQSDELNKLNVHDVDTNSRLPNTEKVYGRPVNVGSCRYKTLGGSGKEANTTRVGLPFLKDGLSLPSDVSTMDMKGKDDNKKSYAYTIGKPNSDPTNKHKGNYQVYSTVQRESFKDIDDRKVAELNAKLGTTYQYCPEGMDNVAKTINDPNQHKQFENSNFTDEELHSGNYKPPHTWTAEDLIEAKRMLKQGPVSEKPCRKCGGVCTYVSLLPDKSIIKGCWNCKVWGNNPNLDETHYTVIHSSSRQAESKRGVFAPWYKLHWKNSIKKEEEERVSSFISFPKHTKRRPNKKRSKKEFTEDRINSFISFSTPSVNKCTKEEEYILTWDEDDVDEDVINFIPRNNCDPFP